ncbi:polysaccharide deacetylase family protein [Gephyromycinifex aptenodytis]|uniref:polysaccharide deacetylase family protein n=1 Tax=Gephyromycinifex aptenodytis TaxID=2716227 RepID=UPI001444AD77|nr:polysaccharide deacetylase family protein [Gephyromycinifex aptenodytis]
MSALRGPRSVLAAGALALVVFVPVVAGNAEAAPVRPRGPVAATPTSAPERKPARRSTAQAGAKPKSAATLSAVAKPSRAGAQRPRTRTVPRAKAGATAAPTRRSSSSPTRSRTSNKVVYLTFDDGPNRVTTPKVLALLKKHDAKATFFMVGDQAQGTGKAALVRRVRAAGHAVGSHTYSHPALTTLPSEQIRRELRRTDALIGRTTCMRPPGGATNSTVASIARTEGKRVVLWNVDTMDWRRPGAAAILTETMSSTRPGSVVLMHDGGGPRAQTVQALAEALPRLAAQGYRFETLPSCRVGQQRRAGK